MDWSKSRNVISYAVDRIARIWYGYEVKGLQNIPESGAVLIVFYHAALPLDIIMFISRLYRQKRETWTVVDRFVKNFRNGKSLMEFGKLVPGNINECERLLRSGECLIISPGGTYEALFSDNTYKLLWRERLGFAKLALDTNPKVIPAFTKNTREAWVACGIFNRFWHRLYEKLGLIIKPVYGCLPVKLTTVLGEPISISDCKTPSEVKFKVQREVENLIAENQQIPGSMWSALVDRFL